MIFYNQYSNLSKFNIEDEILHFTSHVVFFEKFLPHIKLSICKFWQNYFKLYC